MTLAIISFHHCMQGWVRLSTVLKPLSRTEIGANARKTESQCYHGSTNLRGMLTSDSTQWKEAALAMLSIGKHSASLGY